MELCHLGTNDGLWNAQLSRSCVFDSAVDICNYLRYQSRILVYLLIDCSIFKFVPKIESGGTFLYPMDLFQSLSSNECAKLKTFILN